MGGRQRDREWFKIIIPHSFYMSIVRVEVGVWRSEGCEGSFALELPGLRLTEALLPLDSVFSKLGFQPAAAGQGHCHPSDSA